MQYFAKGTAQLGQGNWGLGDKDDDGYRHFVLPPPGSIPAPTPESVNEICDAWFVVQSDLVRCLMHRVAGYKPDLVDWACAATAVAYFQSVRNGNGIAKYVRLHLTGAQPIREPKGLFIRTIELHRSAALRELKSAQSRNSREIPIDPSTFSVLDKRSTHRFHEPVDDLLELRNRLLALSYLAPPDPTLIAELLVQLERRCSEHVKSNGLLAARTPRQRLVFLLRIDPLADVADLALEYDRIVALATAAGLSTSTDALRQSVRDLRQSLRASHRELADQLRS